MTAGEWTWFDDRPIDLVPTDETVIALYGRGDRGPGRWLKITCDDDFYGTAWIDLDTGNVVELHHDTVWPETIKGDDGTIWFLVDGGSRGGAYRRITDDGSTFEAGGIWRPAAARPIRIDRWDPCDTIAVELP